MGGLGVVEGLGVVGVKEVGVIGFTISIKMILNIFYCAKMLKFGLHKAQNMLRGSPFDDLDIPIWPLVIVMTFLLEPVLSQGLQARPLV